MHLVLHVTEKTVFYFFMEAGMYEENLKLIFNLFQLRLLEISSKYGMGQVYIQGQLEEACHQLKLQRRKLHRN